MAPLVAPTGAKIRAHSKTHKSPVIAHLQMARGAVGQIAETRHALHACAGSAAAMEDKHQWSRRRYLRRHVQEIAALDTGYGEISCVCRPGIVWRKGQCECKGGKLHHVR